VGWDVIFSMAAIPLLFFQPSRPHLRGSFRVLVFNILVMVRGHLGSDPPYAIVAKELLLSESFQSLSSQNDSTRPNHSTLMNSGRETRKNGPSPKMFSGSSEQELGSAISILVEKRITLQRAGFWCGSEVP